MCGGKKGKRKKEKGKRKKEKGKRKKGKKEKRKKGKKEIGWQLQFHDPAGIIELSVRSHSVVLG